MYWGRGSARWQKISLLAIITIIINIIMGRNGTLFLLLFDYYFGVSTLTLLMMNTMHRKLKLKLSFNSYNLLLKVHLLSANRIKE